MSRQPRLLGAYVSILVLALVAPGCADDSSGDTGTMDGSDATSDEVTGSDDSSDSSGSGDTGAGEVDSGDTGAGVECTPTELPLGDVAMQQWLAGGDYLEWAAESAPHESAGPHFGNVRTFVDDCLSQSLDAGLPVNRVGSTSVKQLFGSGQQVLGWAVMHKVADGEGGDSWYWYELYQGNVFADGAGDSLCTGCHSGGTDFVLTPWPLQ